jgi:Transcription factor WhiB
MNTFHDTSLPAAVRSTSQFVTETCPAAPLIPIRRTDATPCAREPAAWFDPRRQAFTGRQCLRCPARAECAQSALDRQPSYGMWAGVWIDGDFSVKQRLLSAIAASCAELDPDANQAITAPATPPRARPPGRRRRVGALLTTPPPAAIAVLITARASGHCEIMAPACTYQQAVIFSRRRRAERDNHQLRSAADGIAACGNCVDLIEHTDLPTVLDLGYLVDARTPTSITAMLWRQHRWVYLDTRGRIQIPTSALTNTAC